MMSSNLLCSSSLYTVPDQSITASDDLLKGLLRDHGARSAPRVAPSTGPGVGLFSVFQTIWISNHDSACESVRQFDLVQLFLNGLAQFSTGTQDLKKNRAEILAFANEKDLGRVEFVEETASGRTAWRDRKIVTVLDGLGADDILIVSERGKAENPGLRDQGQLAPG